MQRLRERREAMGITQTAMSLDLGWPQQRLSAIEVGARRLDVMEFLHLTARLGLSPEEAFGLAVEVSTSSPTKKATRGER